MKIAKVLLGLVLTLLLIGAGLLGYGYWLVHKTLPQVQGDLQVTGLESKVTVYRDALGIPHIYASSLDDVAFAQGYVTAQDRLWQMDIFRRNALGELSEIFGEQTLRLDEKHRRLGFPEVAQAAIKNLDPDSQRLIERYTAGVNQFIRTHLQNLPVEFRLLRYQPRPWRPSDTMAVALMMAETLNNTWERDLFRGTLLEKYGPQMLEDLYPTHSKYEIPLVGVDSPSPMELLNLPNPQALPATQQQSSDSVPAPQSEQGSAAASLLWAVTPEKSYAAALDFISQLNDPDSNFLVGSNNWVVSGAHTVSGKPLLANDPHLAHSIPSIWCQVHLHAAGLNVIGVSLPGVPGVVIGHNERIAWGMTNLNPDVQDVYVEKFDSDEGTQYRVNGQWVQANIREETIRIKGRPDRVLAVLVTRHGPVMRRNGNMGYALKWTALDPKNDGYPFLKLNMAANWTDFVTALQTFGGPTQNIVYADIDGNIGLYDAGKIPMRRNGIGNVPLPGSTDDYEWDGYIPYDELPHAFNPPDGIIVTANQRIIGDSYPYYISSDWEAPYRFARIHQLLTAQKTFSRDDFLRIQGDVYTEADRVLAGIIIQAFQRAPVSDPEVTAAIDRLKHGNFIATPDSVEITLAEYMRWRLEESMLRSALGDEWKNYHSGMEPIFLEDQLQERPSRWLPNGYKNYDEFIIDSLVEVCHELAEVYGSSDVSNWTWGKRYPLLFHHPLGNFFPLNFLLNVGPFVQPGTSWSVKQTTSLVGPSMRMVVDFSDFNHSYNNITLGASGQVFSPHYKDQIGHWLEAKSYPMHFTDSDVKKNAVDTLVLRP